MVDPNRDRTEGGSHAPLGATGLGKAVVDERRRTVAGMMGQLNYAAVQLANDEVLIESSGGGKGPAYHAEQKVRGRIERRRAEVEHDPTLSPSERQLRLAGLEIIGLYAERQPCLICQHWLPSEKTTWTFPWEPPSVRPDGTIKAIQKVIRERL